MRTGFGTLNRRAPSGRAPAGAQMQRNLNLMRRAIGGALSVFQLLSEREQRIELFSVLQIKEFRIFRAWIARLAATSVNADESEFGGVFVSKQPGDTDMGGKVPKEILAKGSFYAHVESN